MHISIVKACADIKANNGITFDHIECEDAPANMAPYTDVVEQPEVCAEGESQDTAGVE